MWRKSSRVSHWKLLQRERMKNDARTLTSYLFSLNWLLLNWWILHGQVMNKQVIHLPRTCWIEAFFARFQTSLPSHISKKRIPFIFQRNGSLFRKPASRRHRACIYWSTGIKSFIYSNKVWLEALLIHRSDTGAGSSTTTGSKRGSSTPAITPVLKKSKKRYMICILML